MDSDDDSQPFSGFDQIGDEEYDSVSEEELDETEETEDDEDCRSVNSSDDPEDTLLPSPSANSLDESDIDDLDDLETTQDIEACSNHSFYSQRTEEASSQASHSPPLSPLHRCINNNEAVEALSPEYGMEEGGSHSHDCMTDVEDEERLIQEISAAEGSSHTQERSCRKRPYNEVNAVTEETHTPKCCTTLLTRDIKGWKLHIPQDDEDVRPRNRSELLRLLNELTTLLKFFDERKCNVENLEYFRRLVCKLRHNLSPYKSNVYQPACSCPVLSESCSGLVRGPPILMENIRCEYTQRVLPPVIFQTFEMKPPWLRIHEEIIMKVRDKKVPAIGCIREKKRPLTFAHITSQHVPAIQCLLATYFWSNVDVSTVLQYPEFTCVVLYGNLVVGFGYLSPGAHRNEGYINFLFVRPHWRRCGIGETILYLLRQQCLLWTLTLHVPPYSEALNLYHKFGFKTYCRIKNFYVGYVLSNSQSERDALFMKLESRIPQIF